MESTVTVRTDEVNMEKLFDMDETFKIRYLVRRHENDYRGDGCSWRRNRQEKRNFYLRKFFRDISQAFYDKDYCKNENYVKSVMKTDEIRWLVKKIQDEEKTSEMSR